MKKRTADFITVRALPSLKLGAVLATLLLSSPLSVIAEKKLPPLQTGMTYSEVVGAWGAPEDRDEREIKRQNVWYYKSAQVVFEEGRVQAWEYRNNSDGTKSATGGVGPAHESVKSTPKPAVPTTEKSEHSEIDDLLGEIMKDVPSEPDSTGGGNNYPTTMPPPIQPLPGVGLPPPPGMPNNAIDE